MITTYFHIKFFILIFFLENKVALEYAFLFCLYSVLDIQIFQYHCKAKGYTIFFDFPSLV